MGRLDQFERQGVGTGPVADMTGRVVVTGATSGRVGTSPTDRSIRATLRTDIASVEGVRIERLDSEGEDDYQRYRVVTTGFRSAGPNVTTSLSAVIDERGFVRSYNRTAVVRAAGRTYRSRQRITFSCVGRTGVPDPPGLRVARNATAPAGR